MDENKVKLILIECEDNKRLATSWWTYLGMMLSFLFPLFTAEFQPFLWFSADIIKAIFILMSIFFAVVTLVAIIKRIMKRKKISIEYCAEKIKNSKTWSEKSL